MITKVIWVEYTIGAILSIIGAALTFTGPLLLKTILTSFKETGASPKKLLNNNINY